MGLGDFLKGVGDAATNVAKGAAFVADPRNLDDIAEGVGKAAEFVVENPGKTWDTAFEVGRAVVKDQLDPMNLAINAGLIGLTVATGGAAAPAFLAKMGMGAKSVEAGVAATKGVQAATKGAKAVDTAMDVTKGVKTTAKALDTVGDIGKGVETAADVSRNLTRTQEFASGVKQVGTGIRESKGLAKVENIMNAPREAIATGREAIGLSRYGKMAELRAGGAEKIMAGAGEGGAGGLRKAAARTVAGKNNPLTPAGAQTTVSRVTSLAGRGKAASQVPGSVEKGVEVAADPAAAARDAAMAEAERRMGEIGRGTGYIDRGMAAESLYQPSAIGQAPGGAEMQYAAAETPKNMGAERFYGGDEPPAFVPAKPPPGGKPPGSDTMASALPQPPAETEAAEPLKQPKAFKGGWKPSQHFWEGPGREAFGGIRAGHDWRQIQMRRVESPSVRQAGRYSTHKAKVSAYEQQQRGNATNEQYMETASPFNAAAAAPQATKSGATMSDQRAAGSPGSSLAMNEPRSHLLGNVREPGNTPFGAVGPVKEPGDVVDVESYSPMDYGFGAGGGQGRFEFPELGAQPNATYTNPAFRGQSRTSGRKAIGPGTLGV